MDVGPFGTTGLTLHLVGRFIGRFGDVSLHEDPKSKGGGSCGRGSGFGRLSSEAGTERSLALIAGGFDIGSAGGTLAGRRSFPSHRWIGSCWTSSCWTKGGRRICIVGVSTGIDKTVTKALDCYSSTGLGWAAKTGLKRN